MRNVLGIPWNTRKTFQFALLKNARFGRADHHSTLLKVNGCFGFDEIYNKRYCKLQKERDY